MKHLLTLLIVAVLAVSTTLSLEPMKVGFVYTAGTPTNVQVKLADKNNAAIFTGENFTTEITPNNSGVILVEVQDFIGNVWSDFNAGDVSSFHTLDIYVNGTLYSQYRLDAQILAQAKTSVFDNNGNFNPPTSNSTLGTDGNRWKDAFVSENTLHIGPDDGLTNSNELAIKYNNNTNTAEFSVDAVEVLKSTKDVITLKKLVSQEIGNGNTAFGTNALNTNTGTNVTASGNYSAYQNTGDKVTASGYSSAYQNTGDKVTANGFYSAYQNTGDNVTASGNFSVSNNTGDDVTASGSYSARDNTGDKVTASGNFSVSNNNGDYVTASGNYSARENTGDKVTASGYSSAYQNTGDNVTASGFYSAYNNEGDDVTAIGYFSAYNNEGDNVTASGYSSARDNTGDDVTASGHYSAYQNSGYNVIALGYQSGFSNTNSNVILIGNSVVATADNQVIIGNSDVTETQLRGAKLMNLVGTGTRNLQVDANGKMITGGGNVLNTNTTLEGDGSDGSPLGIDLDNENTWTADQTFNGTTTTVGGNLVLTGGSAKISNSSITSLIIGSDLQLDPAKDLILDGVYGIIANLNSDVRVFDDFAVGVTGGTGDVFNVALATGNTTIGGTLGVIGATTITDLAGTGTRNLQVDTEGKLVVGGESPFTLSGNKVFRNDQDDDFIFGDDDLDYDGIGTERKLYFDASKAAFRVGNIDKDVWDDGVNVGLNSIAMGGNPLASGISSISIGGATEATNYGSIAIGFQAVSSGFFTTALGNSVTADEASSIALGMYNDASITNEILTVGNGVDESNLSNAMVVYKNGNVWSSGFVQNKVTDASSKADVTAAKTSVINYTAGDHIINADLPSAGAGTFLYLYCSSAVNVLGVATAGDEVVTLVNIDDINWKRVK